MHLLFVHVSVICLDCKDKNRVCLPCAIHHTTMNIWGINSIVIQIRITLVFEELLKIDVYS